MKINFKKKEAQSPVLVPEKKKKQTPLALWVVIPTLLLTVALIIGGTIVFNNYQNKKAMEESYKTLQEALNVKLTTDKNLLKVEAAPELTYTHSSDASLEKVPDQIRNLITSYTGDSEINVSSIDISTVGDKQVTLTITKSDRFGQIAQKQEKVVITVVDTQEPQVDIVNTMAKANTAKEAEENVLRVADPVFGYYSYSSTLENHTYKIDLSEVDFETPGVYQAKVIINDSGNIIERYFDVITKDYQIEETVEETIEEEITEVENSENTESESTENNS